MSVPKLDQTRERHWVCAQRLRCRRHALGLTQREVVDRLRQSGAALTNRTLSAMENGRGLNLGLLPDLAAALDCSVTYLLGLTAEPANWQPDGVGATPGPSAPVWQSTGVLSEVPDGFRAPSRIRRRNGSQLTNLA
jgi:transcriptional regulator with XRE-family HTH domain